jgi:dihydrofolate reductase
MKTILWAAVTANGTYMHGGQSYHWPKEVFEDFDRCAAQAGNCIIGRKTHEEYAGSGGDFGRIDVVVVSRTPRAIPGVKHVTSPREALLHLEERGHVTALVGGGDSLLNAFLAEDLADEVIVNLTPELGGIGNHMALAGTDHKPMNLLGVREIGGQILRVHYALRR